MTEWFSNIQIADLTPSALLSLVIVLILLGRLIPRSTYQDKIDEADKWRMAFETEREARATSDAQTSKLLELADITHEAMLSLTKSVESMQDSGGPNALSSSSSETR